MIDRRSSLSASNTRAWCATLVGGLVVAAVVCSLLERLRRAVAQVERGVDDVWAAGQRVAHNTATTHLLTTTKQSSAELLEAVEGLTEEGT